MDTNAWISIGSIVVTVAAILAAPIVALRVSAQLQKRNTQEDAKLRLFSTLIETRHDALAPDAVRALNSIDLVFVNDLSVREAWSRYYVAIIDENLNNQVGWRIREERRRDLLLSMINAMNMPIASRPPISCAPTPRYWWAIWPTSECSSGPLR